MSKQNLLEQHSNVLFDSSPYFVTVNKGTVIALFDSYIGLFNGNLDCKEKIDLESVSLVREKIITITADYQDNIFVLSEYNSITTIKFKDGKITHSTIFIGDPEVELDGITVTDDDDDRIILYNSLSKKILIYNKSFIRKYCFSVSWIEGDFVKLANAMGKIFFVTNKELYMFSLNGEFKGGRNGFSKNTYENENEDENEDEEEETRIYIKLKDFAINILGVIYVLFDDNSLRVYTDSFLEIKHDQIIKNEKNEVYKQVLPVGDRILITKEDKEVLVFVCK